MDEVKIKSPLVLKLINKIVEKAIKSSTGVDLALNIAEITAQVGDDSTVFHLDVHGNINNDQYTKFHRLLE